MSLAGRLRKAQMSAAVAELLGAQNVYIGAHIAPDGDAVGSMLGLGAAMRRLGKTCTLACADPIPLKFDFLAGMRDVAAEPPMAEEVIVCVDCSDAERLGSLYQEDIFQSRPVINIDHHVTNTGYGSINLVQFLPSTAEIVLSVVKQLGVGVDKEIASALLTGLVTDTRCFRTGNVTQRQLSVAMELMRAGASLSEITELVFSRDPFAAVCLWGQSLASVQRRGSIIWAEISQDMIRKCQASPNDDNGLVSFLAGKEGVDVAIVFRETDDGRIDASMRSGPRLDISGAAKKLGGGGHPRAAGCTVAGSMEAVRNAVLVEVEGALGEQRASLGNAAESRAQH